MKQVMFTIQEVTQKIRAGRTLFLAGDEQALRQLPQGNWIGGTIPYFMAEPGGVCTQEHIYATELPAEVLQASVRYYPVAQLDRIYLDIPDNGVGLIVIPATSAAHVAFALNAPNYPGFATRPLVGWITGVYLNELGKIPPKIFDGVASRVYEDGALVLHLTLPPHKTAEVNIINIFEPADGDVLTFPQDSFSAKEVWINGTPRNLAEYIQERSLDIRFPLIANYAGAVLNISFQQVDQEGKQVSFYAPVFKGIEYTYAKPVENYVEKFLAQLALIDTHAILFSCNCILNYLYAELEGKQTGGVTGPMTFGEIAYQLMNQTLVYLSILDVM